ncbi:MAG: hypothetical protein KKH28_05980 [Elusimicrobia bacterium]|nr:hypothetical protein [Elusimicrobiota bacterium]
MRNSHVLAFVFVMFVSALFIANYKKAEIGNYPAGTLSAAVSKTALASTLKISPSTAPRLPPAAVPRLPPAAEPPPAPVPGPALSGPAVNQQAFQGPVCVYVPNPWEIALATEGMTPSEAESFSRLYAYAKLFLENLCARYVPAGAPVLFVKNDGVELSQDCDYGFILFDGVKAPYMVRSIDKIKQEYYAYFEANPQPTDAAKHP